MFNITNLNGIIGDILNGITDAIIGVINSFLAPIFNAVLSVFYQIIFGSMCGILNACQKLFRMFAGTESVVYTEAGKTAFGQNTVFGGTTGNMVFDFLLSQTVISVFTKIIVLAVALLIIFTIVAIIKNEYSTDVTKADNNKFKILASSGRALMGLLFVPVMCILGIYASNQLLIAIDQATNSGSAYMGTRVFVACSFNANRARIDEDFAKAMCIPEGDDGVNYSSYWDKVHNNYNFGVTMTGDSEQALSTMMEKVANKIDNAFLANSEIPGGSSTWNNDDSGFGTGIVYEKISGVSISPDSFDCTNFWVTFYYYDLWEFDFVMAGIVIVILVFLYIKLLITLAKRIYEIILLFLSSPVLLAMMPLDGGEAIKKWKKSFIEKVLMVYSPVVAMNLFLSIFGMFTSVDSLSTIVNGLLEFTGEGLLSSTATGLPLLLGAKGILMKAVPGLYVAYNLITCIFMIAGVMVVDQTSKWVAEWIGAEDAINSGKEQSKKGKDMLKTGMAMGTAALTGGASLVGGAFRGAVKAAAMTTKASVGGAKGIARGATRGARAVGNRIKNRELIAKTKDIRKHADKTYKGRMNEYKTDQKDAKDDARYYRKNYGKSKEFQDIESRYNELINMGVSSKDAVNQMKSSGNFGGYEAFIDAVSGVDIVKDQKAKLKQNHDKSRAMISSMQSRLGRMPLSDKKRSKDDQALVDRLNKYDGSQEDAVKTLGRYVPIYTNEEKQKAASAQRKATLKQQKARQRVANKQQRADEWEKEKEKIYQNAANAYSEYENRWNHKKY